MPAPQPTSDVPQAPDSIYLNSRVGGSDKDYKVSLEQADGGWIVNFAYGRRGSTLKTGTKTAKGALPYADARKIYDKIVKGQLADGYVPVGASSDYFVQNEKVHSGIQCMLMNAVEEMDDVDALIYDPAWVAQEKHNGMRMLFRKGGKVDAINRRGLEVGYPLSIGNEINQIPGEFVIDGEAVGDTFYAFDILEHSSYMKEPGRVGATLRDIGFEDRSSILKQVLDAAGCGKFVKFSKPEFTATGKRALLDRVVAEGREGIVFKRRDGRYSVGKPHSGGDILKYKLWYDCSVVVEAVNDQRSVSMKLFDGSQWVKVGNCTIPANAPVPAVGTVFDVRYMYAYEGGSIYTPVFGGARQDILPEECLMSQLKYKPEEPSSAPRM